MSESSSHQPFSIADLVAYQDGSIVTKVIVKNEKGSVTVFAFDQGQELSEHTAPFDALVHAVDGEIEVKIDGQPHLVSAGLAIVMPAGKPHALKALQKSKMLLTMIRG